MSVRTHIGNTAFYLTAVLFFYTVLFPSAAALYADAPGSYLPFKYQRSYSKLGHEPAAFNCPEDMAFSPDGRYLAVADTQNNRVQLFSVRTNASGTRRLFPEMVYGDIWPWDNRIAPIDSADAYREKDFLNGRSGELTGRAYQHGQSRIRPGENVPMDHFNLPAGITWLGTGTILVADTGNHRIKALALNGEIKFILGQEGWKDGYFHQPMGIDASCEGELYVTEPRSGYIPDLGLDILPQKLSAQGNRLQIFENNLKPSKRRLGHMHALSGIEYHQLKDPTRVMTTLNGDIYLTDNGNHRILIFDKELIKKKELIKWELYKMRYPNGIDLSLDGRLAIADTGNHKVLILDPDFNLIQVIGKFGTGEGRFIKPRAVRFGPDGDLYVLDSGNSRIQVFSGSKIRQFPRCPRPEPEPEPAPLPTKLEEVLPPPAPPKDSY